MSGVLDGKVVIVTGAGRGLGRAYAHDIAREGAVVFVNDVDAEAATTVADEVRGAGGEAVAATASVSDWAEASSIVERAQREFGRIDGLVNNAGLHWMGPSWKQDERQIRDIVEANVLGALFIGTLVSRVMVEQQSGAIVNATSSAQMGIPELATYGATKGALASLTYGWALDLGPQGIRVNAFSPSAVTRMVDPERVPTGHLGEPSSNAPVVSYLLSDLAQHVNGQVVQWRQGALVIVGHPHLTTHEVRRDSWTARSVADEFGPVLAAHSQPVGWRIGS